MVQEVQTDVVKRTETTLETIEAIWTSSRKIIIDRQTRQRYYWASGITYSQTIPYDSYSPWTTSDMSGTVTLSNKIWGMDYLKIDNTARIPIQWNYSITVTPQPWWVAGTFKTKLRVNDDVVMEITRSTNDSTPETWYYILWKFDLVKVTIQLITTGNPAWEWNATAVIQRL